MKDMNFNKILKCVAVLGCVMILSACEKPNEVPPPSETFIREYRAPDPVFLSEEERELVNQQREEYNKL